MAEKEHVIVGTAGHIDHGKSSLVRALTGIDPDTLPEEKERGMTIELGFVFLDLPEYEKQIVFIDVPGHEKFVRTMVAGASNVDAVLFVVAADEGISVQTREHFDVLRLLSVNRGIIALTKADLVDAARIGELTTGIRSFVRGTFLEEAPILPVSSTTGAGLDGIRAALMDAGRRVAKREDCGFFRMPVDRVFVMQGFGTVVAGTVLSGTVGVGDRVAVLPDGLETRIRGLQVHRSKREASGLGRRTALNLQDLDKDALRRGQCLSAPGFLAPSVRLDARLHLLADAPKELKTRDRVRFHIGTDEAIARVVLLDVEKLLPGGSALAQFVLESPVAALYKDRFIIRTFSPLNTVGGGEVLDTAPVRHKRFDSAALEGIRRFEGTLDEAVLQAALKADPKPVSAAEVARSLGKAPDLVGAAADRLTAAGTFRAFVDGSERRFMTSASFERLSERALAGIRDFFKSNPQRPSIPPGDIRSRLPGEAGETALKLILGDLLDAGRIVRADGGFDLPGREARFSGQDQAEADRVEAVFRKAGFEPPLEEDACRELRLPLSRFRKIMGALVQQGRLIRLDPKVTLHREAWDRARRAILQYLDVRKSVTIAEAKDVLKVSRKYACAVLEHLDRTGVTRRAGDTHVLK